MFLKKWDDLPESMKNDSVKVYYDLLCKKQTSLIFKRIFDLLFAIIALVVLSPVFLILSIAIKVESKGPVIFRQVRVTQYGKKFTIFKFRTMVNNADRIGTHITIQNDCRITRVGKFLRRFRLDELPQLFNIIVGDMSFVGTRPEVVEYVEKYTDEMMATLLLPAGVTSEASINYKDEEAFFAMAENVDDIYVKIILPEKMNYNLYSIKNFSFWRDIGTMIKTVFAVIK